jgi:cytochrome c peroxidase
MGLWHIVVMRIQSFKPSRALAASALAVAACLGLAGARAQPLPAVSVPAKAEAAARVAVGRQLFFDTSLSADARISCASCHQPEKAFSDGRKVALGIGNRAGLRNSPSLLNVGHHRAFFWDGRVPSLEQQVLEPLTNPDEHGFAKLGDLLTRLREQAPYRAAFSKAFAMPGAEAIRAETVAAALAAFVHTLVSPESAIDRFVLKGDKSALGAEARAGLELFRGRAQCASCHLLNDDAGTGRVQLSDQQFHARGQA